METTIKTKQDLIFALQITLVDALQRRDLEKAKQCSALLKKLYPKEGKNDYETVNFS